LRIRAEFFFLGMVAHAPTTGLPVDLIWSQCISYTSEQKLWWVGWRCAHCSNPAFQDEGCVTIWHNIKRYEITPRTMFYFREQSKWPRSTKSITNSPPACCGRKRQARQLNLYK